MIEFRNVTYRYPEGSRRVLDGLSFRIPDEGITAIMGANGSGKSTAALCMNGILLPDSGSVVVDGIATDKKSNHTAVRRAVGIVFQNPNHQFTSLTVERELAFGLENAGRDYREMKERVEECLRLFELEDYRTQLPASLSGGEKQRVALAAVAILEPKYLVLDEATSLFSPLTRKAVLRLVALNAAKTKSAVVLITQFPGEAKLADRLLLFKAGSLGKEGVPGTLLREADDLRSFGIQVPLSARFERHEH